MLGHDGGRRTVPAARGDEDDLLLASGAICATLLLCDLPGVHDGPAADTPAGFLNVSDVDGLPFAGAAADALGTRLFQADGEGRFSCLHRSIAEYLGAAWLTHCVEDGPTGAGVLSLFDPGGGVPGCSPVPAGAARASRLDCAARPDPGLSLLRQRIPMGCCATARWSCSPRIALAPFSPR